MSTHQPEAPQTMEPKPINRHASNIPSKQIGQVELWEEHLIASSLSPTVRVIGVLVAVNLRNKWDLSYTALSEGARVSERTAIRAISTLEKTGWLTVERERGQSNHYALRMPTNGGSLRYSACGMTTSSRDIRQQQEKLSSNLRAAFAEHCRPSLSRGDRS